MTGLHFEHVFAVFPASSW